MHLIRVVELASLCILALGVLDAARTGRLGTLSREWTLASAGALLAEASILRLYGFYAYDERFSLFVDRMPLLVALIWGYVIASARQVASSLAPGRPAWAVGLVVLYDAALIEPVSSHAGLWRWDEPGLFSVPWIGWLGWGIYAALASWALDRRGRGVGRALSGVGLAVLGTHAGLLALWWGALRWVGRSATPEPRLVAGAWALALGLAVLARARRLPRSLLLARAPAGLFFYGLAAFAAVPAPLALYAAAFALPWLAAVDLAKTRPSI